MSTHFKRILYGGDYNPNQWTKDIWQEDMRIFKDAHINTATINVFSWAKIQPSEHEYNFDELDEIVDMLSKENYDIVFATSTAALPGWMVRKYPEVIHALEVRHDMYNQTTAYVRLLEQQGDVCVIRPDASLNIKQVVHDPAELKRVYDLGRKAGEAKLKDVQAFLA